jgi:NTP pyrophosphatase (non-canonical NTP hydrolase)
MASISELQKRAWENKLNHGFDTTHVEREFWLLNGEVAEAFEAWLKKDGELDLELADVFIYTLSLAQMNGIDLESAVLRKMAINEKRKYKEVNGVLVKDE